MCDTCGCNVTPGNRNLVEDGGRLARTADGHESLEVLEGLLAENDHCAEHNRAHFDRHGVLAVNLMSSPGSGKTALLEATARAMGDGLRVGAVVGDLETENDARRLREAGIPAIQITTGTACHLDAHMVHDALHEMDLDELDVLFIENVGNLVCPASFDLGQHLDVTLLSVTEGDDKPAKYPVMFRRSSLNLVSKVDLLSVIDDFDIGNAECHIRKLANGAPVLALSSRTGKGMDAWIYWIRAAVEEQHHSSTEGCQPVSAAQV